MKQRSVRYQAAVLTGTNAVVRALGFVLRVALGRLLGAQALGVMELGHSAHMLSITPVTAGLPLAVSRLTARDDDSRALAAGRSLVYRVSAVMIPLWVILAPVLAYLLGDMRTLLPLWVFTPCILVLGLSAVYNGYCYGRGLAWPPALSELSEQVIRFALSAALLLALPNLTVSARAAVPGLATMTAETAGLFLVMGMLKKSGCRKAPAEAAVRREIVALSVPLTVSRLITTLLRTATGALLPRRLVVSGLSLESATAALGMLQGMVMPVLFLPGVFTSALGMVGAPAIARREGAKMRRMALQLFLSALGCGVLGMIAIRLFAPFLANGIYHEPALEALFAASAPLTLFFALQQAANTLLSGVGEQKKTLLPTVAGAALTLYLLYRFAAAPSMRLFGAVYAMLLGRALTVAWELAQVFFALRVTGSAESAAQPGD